MNRRHLHRRDAPAPALIGDGPIKNGRYGRPLSGPPASAQAPQAQTAERVTWAALGALGTLLAMDLLQRPESTPTANMSQVPEQDPWKWPRRIALTWAGLYAGNQLLKLLDTLPLPTTPRPQQPQPTPPVDLVTMLGDLPLAPAPAASETARDTWSSPTDARWLRVAPHPSVILVIGKRGSGKSALGYRLLELYHDQAAPYAVALPPTAAKLLPDWIGTMDRLEDVPPGAAVLLDEAYIQLHARDSMSREGRDIGTMVNLSRQKRQTLIFIVQEARQLDVNAISQADVIAIKELSEISKEFERRELRAFTGKARAAFSLLPGDKRRQTWVYSESASEVGLIENSLASFWRPALSHAFAGSTQEQRASGQQRRGAKTPRVDLRARAKGMRQAGHSYGQISKALGVSKSYAFKLVGEDGQGHPRTLQGYATPGSPVGD